MFCRFCGAKLVKGARFCSKCGKAINPEDERVSLNKEEMAASNIKAEAASDIKAREDNRSCRTKSDTSNIDESLNAAKDKAADLFDKVVKSTKAAASGNAKNIIHGLVNPDPNMKQENYGGRFPTDHSRYTAFLVFMWVTTLLSSICLFVKNYALTKAYSLAFGTLRGDMVDGFGYSRQMANLENEYYHFQSMADTAGGIYGLVALFSICVGIYILFKAGVLSYFLKLLLGIFISLSIALLIFSALGKDFLRLFFPVFLALSIWANRKKWKFIRKYLRYIGIYVVIMIAGIFSWIVGVVALGLGGLMQVPFLFTVSFVALLMGLFGPPLAIHLFLRKEERKGMPFLESMRLLTVVLVTAIFFIVGIVGLISVPALSVHHVVDNFDWGQFDYGLADTGTAAYDVGPDVDSAGTPSISPDVDLPAGQDFLGNPSSGAVSPDSSLPQDTAGTLSEPMEADSSSVVGAEPLAESIAAFPDMPSFMEASLPQFHQAGFVMDPNSMVQYLPTDGQGIMFQTADGTASMTFKEGNILAADGNMPIGRYHYDITSNATMIEDPTGMPLGKVVGNQLYDNNGVLQVEMSPKNDVITVGYVDGKPAFQIIGKPGNQMVMAADNSEVYGTLKRV